MSVIHIEIQLVFKEPELTPAQKTPAQRALQNPATFGAATDDLDIDIDIDPNDPLSANVIVINTAGATVHI